MKKISFWILTIAAIFGAFWVYNYGSKISAPIVAEDGSISGEYSLEGIESLGKPYECAFEKSDQDSRVVGIVHTDGKNFYGEFRISTSLAEKEFNSFLLSKDGEAYSWTSLNQNAGFKSVSARNASASKIQIIGAGDVEQYNCKIWQNPDQTFFDPPTWVSFQEI